MEKIIKPNCVYTEYYFMPLPQLSSGDAEMMNLGDQVSLSS